MADQRFNQVPGFVGGGFNMVPQNSPMPGGPGMYMQPGMPMNPMMQQQMMMNQGYRFPMQAARMGPPNTPPPPYSAHSQVLSMAGPMPARPRASLSKSKGTPQQSEKERFFEEQRQKLRQFGRPGAVKVDADKLIGSMFAADTKIPPQSQEKVEIIPAVEEEDGFGEFLQGPSAAELARQSAGASAEAVESGEPAGPEPLEEQQPVVEEKKDLTSMMLECSDLNAPQKARGFHKPTLNEVQKPHHGNHKQQKLSFHESDHSRGWKHTEDLEGLFQMPGGVVPGPPTGPPPAYADVASSPPSLPVMMGVPSPTSHPPDLTPEQSSRPAKALPEWCSYSEDQMPPVYKHVWEASLVEGKISTERLYPILLLSGLQREKLAQIWSLCNTSSPGQLVKQELWLVLALIALTQNNYNTMSQDILARCPVPPVPAFAHGQDSSAPATLPTSSQQQQPHPQPHAEPSPLTVAQQPPLQSHPQHQPPLQQQLLQQQSPVVPVVASQNSSTHSGMKPLPTTAAPPCSSGAAANAGEDDFADFQVATPAVRHTPATTTKGVAMPPPPPRTDDGFGEFIGGGNIAVRGGGFGLSYPGPAHAPHSHQPAHPPIHQPGHPPVHQPAHLPSHSHVGNGVVMMGNGHVPNHPHHHPAPPPVAPEPPSMPPMMPLPLPSEDKYNNNVRSFFCSSDSSTGHTSPSFEDDDFTDGRDSLSQVSTSEQSENEDIRNFENYVEEFNRKKESTDGSPLHCPFPTVPANAAAGRNAKPSGAMKLPVPSGSVAVGIPGPPVGTTAIGVSSPGVLSPPQGQSGGRAGFGSLGHEPSAQLSASPEFDDFKSAPMSSSKPMTVPSSMPVLNMNKNQNSDEDFADFKSASELAGSGPVSSAPAGEVSLIGEEDKYGALRVLTLDSPQPSLFEKGQGPSDPALGETAMPNEDASAENADGDDWADFAEAPAASGSAVGSEVSFPASVPAGVSSDPAATTTVPSSTTNATRVGSNKGDILKLFSAGMTGSGSGTLASLTSGDLSSAGGSKSGSLFGDDASLSQTPSAATSHGLDASIFGDSTPSSSLPSGDATTSTSLWVTNLQKEDGDWSDFSGPGMQKHQGSFVEKNVPSGGVGDSSDNWGQFSAPSSLGLNSNPSVGDMSMAATFGSVTDNNSWGDFSQMSNNPGSSQADDDDWCDFSTAGVGDAGSTDVGEGEGPGGGGSAHMVTIKKQNLGTSEILGLFKVREDAATLSSYQLPTQTTPTAATANSGLTGQRNGSGSRPSLGAHGKRLSSDFDDDMGPPPMDFGQDDDEDEHAFSRGYDLDDILQRPPPTTTYSPFGLTQAGHVYSRASGVNKVKESKEDSGSVHSLELPSAHPNDPSGTDSQSVSSADLTGTEAVTEGDIAPAVSAESKSLDSLDLKLEPLEVDSGTGKEDSSAQQVITTPISAHQPAHQPIQPQELLDSMPDFADKYNIEREAQGSDRYGQEWERCLTSCGQVIEEANTIFNSISSSSVCSEVLKSSQGNEYVTSVIEIYRVVCRVMTSMRATAISTTELEKNVRSIDLAWNNLTAFLVGASLLPDPASLVFTNSVLKSDMEAAQNQACGVCLLNVDSKSLAASSSSSSPSLSLSSSLNGVSHSKLTYAGRQYHATCANFWVNRVDQTLPSLTLSELL
ncbi:synergin gamma isoform X2 [Aplysia californica]|uniref:Synergin gamma isoform X2 n=1 Tax=Aplysia californica TaxID=6500 RepID=A0ABM1A5J2_APLCA|nr:synergin gamma isoform X2 [Aplysia californica]